MLAGDGAVDALRLARDVGALAVALPEWAPCIGLRPAVDDPGATRSTSTSCTCWAPPSTRAPRACRGWRRSGTTSASRMPRATGEHAEVSARIARRALRRLTYDNDTIACRDGARARALLRRGSRAERALARACSWRAWGASAPAICWRCDAGTARAAECTIPADRVAARERFETLVEEQMHQPVEIADLAVRGDDLIAAGRERGPGDRRGAAPAARRRRRRPVAERARHAAAAGKCA